MKKYILSIAFVALGVFPVKAQTIITFYTTMGSFEVELFDTLKPITAGNIKTLVESKFYDGVIFHRVIENFVIQGGDPTGTGTGGPGYTIADEFDSTLSNVKKTPSMANSGPNTGGSQFFINMVDNSYLDFDEAPLSSAHPVFGVVISGWDTVEMIESTPVNGANKPLTDVVMDSVRVTQFPLGVYSPSISLLDMNIYPNPINNNSVIQITSGQSYFVEFTLYNQNGVLVNRSSQTINKGNNQYELSNLGASNLPTGIYSLRCSYNGEVVTKRFIVTK